MWVAMLKWFEDQYKQQLLAVYYSITSFVSIKIFLHFSQCKPDPPFQYNTKDGHYNVDRTSFTGKYEIVDDRPR